MGYKELGKKISFADIAVSRSLENKRSVQMMERINRVVTWKNIEALLVEYYEVGTTKEGADAYGAMTKFYWVNDHGGIGGWKIDFLTRDDGYRASRTVAVTKQFVESDRVFALSACTGTPNSIAVLPHVKETGPVKIVTMINYDTVSLVVVVDGECFKDCERK